MSTSYTPRRYLKFVVYRAPKESYYTFYQDTSNTFSRVVVSPDGNRSHLSFISFSMLAQELYNFATLGYKIADIKEFTLTEERDFFNTLRKDAIIDVVNK